MIFVPLLSVWSNICICNITIWLQRSKYFIFLVSVFFIYLDRKNREKRMIAYYIATHDRRGFWLDIAFKSARERGRKR